jgi:hypothetical protein
MKFRRQSPFEFGRDSGMNRYESHKAIALIVSGHAIKWRLKDKEEEEETAIET